MEKRRFKNTGFCLRRIVTAVVIFTLLFPYFSDILPESEVQAARVLRLEQCKSIAVKNSDKIDSYDIQIEAKQAARESAVRSISEKYINMQTFRWSPLLNFQFPEKPNEAEDFEFKYKPVQLQYDIDTIKHKKEDEKLKIYEDVSNLYIDIITSTMEIGFLKERINTMSMAIMKNKARLLEGTATQSQIDQQQAKLDGFNSSLASEQTKLQRSKEKLGRMLGFDITQGYTFEEVFISSNMSRDCLDQFKAAAMATSMSEASDIKDETVYEAKQAETLAKLALATNESLMKSQYGSNYNMISSYVSNAYSGNKINKKAFKKDYDAFLKKIDEPWQGKKRILFFKFPKVWWKGSIDGIRYVEDDPYVLYSAALEYESALKEYNNARTELSNTIDDGFDNYIETRRAYLTAKDELLALQNKLIEDEARNALGQLSLEEYEGELTEYENARTALKDALSLYSSTLYSYDRTCCGAVSKYFTEESLSAVAGHAGLGTPADSNDGSVDDMLDSLNLVVRKGAIYSIRSIVDSQEFMLYIDIPEGFEYNITGFQLFSDGRQIGAASGVITPKDEAIRHLTITVEDVTSVFIRLFDGETFIDDCAIDPTVATGPLNIKEYSVPEAVDNDKVIGSYTVEEDSNTDMIKLRFSFDNKAIEKVFALGSIAEYYNLSAEQNLFLFSDELIKYDQPFSYMSFIKNDIGKLTLRLFSEDGSYIGGAAFDTATKRLIADTEVTEADMQEMAARALVKARKTAELEAEKTRMTELLTAAVMANGMEADSPTIAYYKQRIEAIDIQISEVDIYIKPEEVQNALINDADEIASLVADMGKEESEESAGGTSNASVSEEELAARAAILEEAAREFAQRYKKNNSEERKRIDDSILSKEQEIAALMAQRSALSKSNTPADRQKLLQLNEQMSALQKDVDNLKGKKAAMENDETAVTAEDIQNALRDHADEIYALAADKLSDAMLYGSETGQYCAAMLENRGFEVNSENMRLAVANADLIETYEALINRNDVLKKELNDAQTKAEALKKEIEAIKKKGGSTTKEESLYKQLLNMQKAYESEIKKNEVNIKKNDPLKDVILKQTKEEKAVVDARIKSLEEAKKLLICNNYSSLSEYARKEKADLDAKNTWLESLIRQRNDREKWLKENISALEGYVNGFDKDAYENKYQDERAAIERELAAYRSKYDDLNGRFGSFSFFTRLFYGNTLDAYKRKISELESRLASLNNEHDRVVGDYDQAKKDLASYRQELSELPGKYDDRIKTARSEAAAAKAAYDKKAGQWNESVEKDRELSTELSEQKAKSNELGAVIREYY